MLIYKRIIKKVFNNVELDAYILYSAVGSVADHQLLGATNTHIGPVLAYTL